MRLEPADVCGALVEINPWWDPANEWAECSEVEHPIECFGVKGYQPIGRFGILPGGEYKCGARYGRMSSKPWQTGTKEPKPLYVRGSSGKLFWWLTLDGFEADFDDRAKTAGWVLRAWFSHRMIPLDAEINTAGGRQEPSDDGDDCSFLPGGVSCVASVEVPK